jgi:hypothetical protein
MSTTITKISDFKAWHTARERPTEGLWVRFDYREIGLRLVACWWDEEPLPPVLRNVASAMFTGPLPVIYDIYVICNGFGWPIFN